MGQVWCWEHNLFFLLSNQMQDRLWRWRGRGSRETLLLVKQIKASLRISSELRDGVVALEGFETPPSEWIRIRTFNLLPRWFRIVSFGEGKTATIFMNSFTVGLLDIDESIVSIEYALWPSFLGELSSDIQNVKISLLQDYSTDQVLKYDYLSLAEVLTDSFRKLFDGTASILDKDQLWIKAGRWTLPVRLEATKEFLLNAETRIVLDLIPVHSSILPLYIERDLVLFPDLFNEMLSWENRLFLLKGELGSGRLTFLQQVAHAARVPLLRIEPGKLKTDQLGLCFDYLSDQPYQDLRRLSLRLNKDAIYVLLAESVQSVPNNVLSLFDRIVGTEEPDELAMRSILGPTLGARAHIGKALAAATEAQLKGIDISEVLRGHSQDIQKVLWSDIAGLEEAKALLKECFLERKIESSQRRRGILLHGPPGTGKTMLAKAVATEFACSFQSIQGPQLLDQYVGESEAHLRQVFAQARQSQPSVIFFDELDSIASARGRHGDSAGVTDRMVAQLMIELDRLQDQNVYVIGATNRPDLLDPALLRPGRFDKQIYLGLPVSLSEQAAILRAAANSYNGIDMVDFETIAASLPSSRRYSPAELASLVHEAMRLALSRLIRNIKNKNMDRNQGLVTPSLADFAEAASNL